MNHLKGEKMVYPFRYFRFPLLVLAGDPPNGLQMFFFQAGDLLLFVLLFMGEFSLGRIQ